MSKKLIAVASAAALALTALVAVPANASAITSVTVVHGSTAAATGDGGTSAQLIVSQTDSDSALSAATAATARNVIFGNSTDTATRTAARATVLTASAASLTITSTLGVKVSASTTDAAGTALKVDAGTQTLTGTTSSANLNYVFYAWNTSTTAGAVTVDTGTSKLTFYVKGNLYESYNITDVTFPASLYIGQTDAKVTFKLTDPYGNAISAAGAAITPTGFGATFAAATYSSTTKLWSSTLSAITQDNVAINLAISPADLSSKGFAKPVKSSFKMISAGDLSGQVTTLTAQVTSLNAQIKALSDQLAASRSVADSVTKKKYNTLARKWNAANPGAKVALKK